MLRIIMILAIWFFIMSILGFSGIAMEHPPEWVYAITKFMFSLKD